MPSYYDIAMKIHLLDCDFSFLRIEGHFNLKSDKIGVGGRHG